jgi:hypothetical protein
MEVRSLTRAALDTWLKAARVPIDAATRALPNGTRGPRAAARLAVDRTDATLRATLGRALRDPVFVADAQQRRVAADKRAEAIRLRAEAEQREASAEQRHQQELRAAEQQREAARREAAEKQAKVRKEREAREKAAERQAAAQQRNIERSREQELAEVESEAKRTRLRVLDDEADAAEKEEEALTAADEAKRLERAAARAKAARKRGS